MKDMVLAEIIESRIQGLRGCRVILDRDLAALYGVPTYRFNEAVKRNKKRFPPDFMFRLTRGETCALISQNAMSSSHGGRRTRPYAFTEHGAVMAANILKSDRAIRMSVFVVRAFVRMRQWMGAQRELAAKLADLENKLTGRLNKHETALAVILRQVISLLGRKKKKEPLRKPIGFTAKEKCAAYK